MANIEPLQGSQNFTVIRGDVLNTVQLADLFARFRFTKAIHLAAKTGVRPSLENASRYADVNIRGTINLLEECVRQKSVRKFFFASSSSVYGNNKRLPFSENDEVNEPISPYAATKRAGELLCFTYHTLFKLPVVCSRFFTVYGPRQRPDMAIHEFVKSIVEGKEITLFGDGSTARDYTYIDDIIDGIIKILDADYQYDIVNLGESEVISLQQLVSLIEQAVGKRAKIRYVVQSPADVNSTFADISKARIRYGYDPKCSFEVGIGKFVGWYYSTIREKAQHVWDSRLH